MGAILQSLGRTIVAGLVILLIVLFAAGTVGTGFPADFPVIEDASLQKPVIGFGAAGPVTRTPVIFPAPVSISTPQPVPQ